MTAVRLGRTAGAGGWKPTYSTTVALLAVAGVTLIVASAVFGTPNRPESGFGSLLIAVAGVIVVARVLGELVARLGQPRVMGEVLGGILLGPSFLGWLPTVFPRICGAAACPATWPFPPQTGADLKAAAEIGLAFYMFLIGLELDPALLRGRLRQAAAISLSSIALPLALGILIAPFLLSMPTLGDATRPAAFTIFIGVSMSITAFPVLARILTERRMLRGRVGSLALACAAIDDVMAWGLLALATALAVAAGPGPISTATTGVAVAAASGPPPNPLAILGLAVAFCVTMGLLARPVLARVSVAYDEAGHVPSGWVVAIFLGVLLAAFVSTSVGIAAIFGAFVMGLAMPRRSELTHDISRRVEDFVVVVLLPLFFVVSGLKTDIRPLLAKPELWVVTILVTAIAIIGKWVGAMVAARVVGNDWRSSAAIGALMNTRGLTELIVLNVGLDLKVIQPDLFAALVVMALVTTFMAGPALRLIDPDGRLSRSPEQEVAGASAPIPVPLVPVLPTRAILVACQDSKNFDSLGALAESIALSGSPREVILVRLVQTTRLATRFSAQQMAVSRATDEVQERCARLAARGIIARGVALTSADLSDDLVRIALDKRIDLALSDGRRSLTEDGVPGGAVGALLSHAACDVAVLVERRVVPPIDAEHAVLVPFGGSEHDWAAVELGAAIAKARGARLRLVGLGATSDSGPDAGGLLAAAALAVQRLSGVVSEPVLAERGREGILAAADAGLLVIGLSRRWKEEGLGDVRRSIAQETTVPTLFIRRGARGGELSGGEAATILSWSSAGATGLRAPMSARRAEGDPSSAPTTTVLEPRSGTSRSDS